QSDQIQTYLNSYYFIVLITGVIATALRYIIQNKSFKRSVLFFDALSILLTVAILMAHFFGDEAYRHISFLYNDTWVKLAILLTFTREFSEQEINYKNTALNPAQLFIASFLSIIFIGALLLMLP